MRELYILSGPPCAGKSTWVKENKLELYTLGIDAVRVMLAGPIMGVNGELCANMKENKTAGVISAVFCFC